MGDEVSDMAKRIFLIGGMHRSGTSYLAHALSYLGLTLPASISPPAKDNQKGHFESFRIVQKHDEILSSLGMSWDTFDSIPTAWFDSEAAGTYVEELEEVLKQDFSDEGPFLVKDPRISILLPLWKNLAEQINVSLFFIAPFRSPFAVAKSLEQRNKIAQARSLMIWLNYMISAESHSRDINRSFVLFPDWVPDFENTIKELQAELDTKFPLSTKRSLLKAATQFEQNFVHYAESDQRDDDYRMAGVAREAFDIFCQLQSNSLDEAAQRKLQGLSREIEEYFSMSTELIVEQEHLRESISEQERAQAEQDKVALDRKVVELTTFVEEVSEALEDETARLETSERIRDQMELNTMALDDKVTELTASVDEVSVALKDVTERLDVSEQLRSEIEKDKATQDGKVTELTAFVDEVSNALKNSTERLETSERMRKEAESAAKRFLVEVESAKLQLNQVHAENQSLCEKTAELEKRLAKQLAEKKEEVDRTKSLRENYEGLAEQHSFTKNELTKTAEQLSAVEQNFRTQSEQLSRKIEEITEKETSLLGVLDTEKKNTASLVKETNILQQQKYALSKEYEEILQRYHQERLTIVKPVYRNVYKYAGLFLRNTLPTQVVELIKRRVPNPFGVPKQLSYFPEPKNASRHLETSFENPGIDAEPDIFVLSIIPWNFRYQRPQHIAKYLSETGRRVFFVEMDQASEGTEIEKISENLYRVNLTLSNTKHIQPYTGQPQGEQLKQWLKEFLAFVHDINATSLKQVIIQHPFWWQMAKHFSPEFEIIFDCMDDMSGFANTEPFLLELEHDMLCRADKLTVSSQYLYDKYKHLNDPCMVRNAGQIEHFKITPSEAHVPSFMSANRTRKVIRVGYVGAIAQWFDAELLRAVANNSVDMEFHLCGEVTNEEAAKLADLANVTMYGEIPYAEAPHFIQQMDVVIIPFKLVPIIQACDPVKFYEYCAAGKPTVATKMPELERVRDLVFFASGASEFEAQIREAHSSGQDKNFVETIQLFATENTWVHRAEKFLAYISEFPKVSVVILSYGDPDLTKATLHSLYDNGHAYPNMEIIVVDNGSSNENLQLLTSFAKNYPHTDIIENGANFGFAKGNNVGIEAATGDYILLLNNDTVVAPGAVTAMVTHLQNNSTIGAVGPLTNNIGNEAKVFAEYADMGEMKQVAQSLTLGYRGQFTSIPVLAYFAVMFRKENLKDFGLLSESYGRGMFEDDDHCAQIKSKGFICALAEDAFVHHHLSATFSKMDDDERTALFEKNKSTYEAKWGPWHAHKYRDHRPRPSLEV